MFLLSCLQLCLLVTVAYVYSCFIGYCKSTGNRLWVHAKRVMHAKLCIRIIQLQLFYSVAGLLFAKANSVAMQLFLKDDCCHSFLGTFFTPYLQVDLTMPSEESSRMALEDGSAVHTQFNSLVSKIY